MKVAVTKCIMKKEGRWGVVGLVSLGDPFVHNGYQWPLRGLPVPYGTSVMTCPFVCQELHSQCGEKCRNHGKITVIMKIKRPDPTENKYGACSTRKMSATVSSGMPTLSVASQSKCEIVGNVFLRSILSTAPPLAEYDSHRASAVHLCRRILQPLMKPVCCVECTVREHPLTESIKR